MMTDGIYILQTISDDSGLTICEVLALCLVKSTDLKNIVVIISLKCEKTAILLYRITASFEMPHFNWKFVYCLCFYSRFRCMNRLFSYILL